MKCKLPISIVAVISFLALPNENFAQTPNLGTAAGFALFSSVGAVGNTGVSQITGNIGTNSGAITGFGNVNGVMHRFAGSLVLSEHSHPNCHYRTGTWKRSDTFCRGGYHSGSGIGGRSAYFRCPRESQCGIYY